jgi:hypothetical protein
VDDHRSPADRLVRYPPPIPVMNPHGPGTATWADSVISPDTGFDPDGPTSIDDVFDDDSAETRKQPLQYLIAPHDDQRST